MADRTDTKIVIYRKCDFCGRESEHPTFPGIHFSIAHDDIGAATMDICSLCQGTITFTELYEKSVEVWKAKQPAPQPDNADVEK